MDIKTAIKTVLQAAGKNNTRAAEFLGISKQAFSIFLGGDFSQIERLIKLCNFCGMDIIITDNKNFKLTLQAQDGPKSEK